MSEPLDLDRICRDLATHDPDVRDVTAQFQERKALRKAVGELK